MNSWFEIPVGTPTLDELPFGVFSTGGNQHLCVAVGNSVLDLHRAANVGLFRGIVDHDVLMQGSLNPILELGPPEWRAITSTIAELFRDPNARARVEPLLLDRESVQLHLPWQVADYVDFYSSRQHAENVGRMFRPNSAPLLPNWRHLPIGYHGRAGTVIVSGNRINRPLGIKRDGDVLSYGPTERLDIEVELGFVLGNPSSAGYPIPLTDARRHVFGVVAVNDWSARDIQAFEYQPLGPFLGKSFATSVSAWVLPFSAIDGARVPSVPQDPPPLRHLAEKADWALDIKFDTWLRRGDGRPQRISTVNSRGLYWTVTQMIAHLSSNGSTVRAGDLIATGTISGDTDDSLGSLLEISHNGNRPVLPGDLGNGFLEDEDEVVITAAAKVGDRIVKLGDVRGRVSG